MWFGVSDIEKTTMYWAYRNALDSGSTITYTTPQFYIIFSIAYAIKYDHYNHQCNLWDYLICVFLTAPCRSGIGCRQRRTNINCNRTCIFCGGSPAERWCSNWLTSHVLTHPCVRQRWSHCYARAIHTLTCSYESSIQVLYTHLHNRFACGCYLPFCGRLFRYIFTEFFFIIILR